MNCVRVRVSGRATAWEVVRGTAEVRVYVTFRDAGRVGIQE